MKRRLILSALLLLSGCNHTPVPTTPPASSEAADHPHSGALLVAVRFDPVEASRASAFLVAPDRVVTCRHVVKGLRPLSLSFASGSTARIGRTVADDEGTDLALLECEPADVPPLRLSNRWPAEGERLRVLSRFGDTPATVTGTDIDPETGRVVILSADDIGEGASGAAVIDRTGAVVGVIRGAADGNAAHVVMIPGASVVALVRDAE